MPETMSVERRNLVKAYGATVKLTSGKEGMKGAIKAAEELRDSIPGSIILQQFEIRLIQNATILLRALRFGAIQMVRLMCL